MNCWICQEDKPPVSQDAWICSDCFQREAKRIQQPVKPRVRVKRWRDHLSDLPGEIEAIEADMYDTGAEIDDVIKQVEDGSYYTYG